MAGDTIGFSINTAVSTSRKNGLGECSHGYEYRLDLDGFRASSTTWPSRMMSRGCWSAAATVLVASGTATLKTRSSDGVARCYNSVLARRAGDAWAGPRGRKQVERDVRGHSAGARRPDQWHRVRRDGRLARLGGLRPQGDCLGRAAVVPAGHCRAAGAVPRRRDGGRADGGWGSRGVICVVDYAHTYRQTWLGEKREGARRIWTEEDGGASSSSRGTEKKLGC